MAADVAMHPHSDRGVEILDELEKQTRHVPFKTADDGTRSYWLNDPNVGTGGFDAILDRIAPDWREHISRTP